MSTHADDQVRENAECFSDGSFPASEKIKKPRFNFNTGKASGTQLHAIFSCFAV
jgi:hypothetical protein